MEHLEGARLLAIVLPQMRNNQTDFFESLDEPQTLTYSHGGSSGLGCRKVRRPFASHSPLHIVFKSTKARGALSFKGFKNHTLVESTLKAQAKRHGVRLMSYVIMHNHVHIKAKASARRGMQNFLRRVGSIIAQKVTKARRGNPFGRFWDALVFSRLLVSKYEELILSRYFEANRIESSVGYEARQDFLLQTRGRKKWKRLNAFAFK